MTELEMAYAFTNAACVALLVVSLTCLFVSAWNVWKLTRSDE